jgi:hypothetical protein
MMVFVVVNPVCYPEFKVFDTINNAMAWLASEGFTLDASREIKDSPRARMFYSRGHEQRIVFCREVSSNITSYV